MADITTNYQWVIPEKFKVDWYNDFLSLINQIDNSLKNEEIKRKQFDQYLLQLIADLGNLIGHYYIYIPLRNTTSSLVEYNSTSWGERVNVSSYTKEYFGLPSNKIVEVKYYVYYRAKMKDPNTTGYIKSRLRQTVPSGQYVETPERTINSTSWTHFSEVRDVSINLLSPDGLLDAMLVVRVSTGTIQAYMDRTFLLLKMAV